MEPYKFSSLRNTSLLERSYPGLEHIVQIGVDEAGRGCLAGKVYAAAVIIPPTKELAFLRELNDSKKLSRKKRQALREKIEENLVFGVGFASPGEIDQINILQATFLAMHRAIKKCLKKYALSRPLESPPHILVDGNRFKPFKYAGMSVPHTTVVKGDAKYLSIAAASILAKEYHDDHIKRLLERHPELSDFGWQKNVGYPTKEHKTAIEERGVSKYHRKTFRGCGSCDSV